MPIYTRILAAADLREGGDRVVDYAATLARTLGAELHVAHIVEPLPLGYGGEFPSAVREIQTSLQNQARMRLREATRDYDVPDTNCHLGGGSASSEIRRLAKDLAVDLVVIGTRRRRGLEFFMGSTSNAVLHDDAFDVLAVRLGNPDAQGRRGRGDTTS